MMNEGVMQVCTGELRAADAAKETWFRSYSIPGEARYNVMREKVAKRITSDEGRHETGQEHTGGIWFGFS